VILAVCRAVAAGTGSFIAKAVFIVTIIPMVTQTKQPGRVARLEKKMLTKLWRLLFGEKDELLFYTHTPEHFQPGKVVGDKIITRLAHNKNSYLASAVYGKKEQK